MHGGGAPAAEAGPPPPLPDEAGRAHPALYPDAGEAGAVHPDGGLHRRKPGRQHDLPGGFAVRWVPGGHSGGGGRPGQRGRGIGDFVLPSLCHRGLHRVRRGLRHGGGDQPEPHPADHAGRPDGSAAQQGIGGLQGDELHDPGPKENRLEDERGL